LVYFQQSAGEFDGGQRNDVCGHPSQYGFCLIRRHGCQTSQPFARRFRLLSGGRMKRINRPHRLSVAFRSMPQFPWWRSVFPIHASSSRYPQNTPAGDAISGIPIQPGGPPSAVRINRGALSLPLRQFVMRVWKVQQLT